LTEIVLRGKDHLDSETGPITVVADTHLGLLAGERFYWIRNSSQCDILGFAGFLNWLGGLGSTATKIARGNWGEPLEIHKPTHLILLGDYLELWDASDAAIQVCGQGINDAMQKLSCEKIHLVGNHDFACRRIAGRFPHGASLIQILSDTYPEKKDHKAEWLKIGDTNYLFLHGHQFDWTFLHLGKAWTILSYMRDGAEAFRLWSEVLVVIGGLVILALAFTFFFQTTGALSSLLWSLALAVLLMGALPRIVITVGRPIWNKFFTARYQPKRALKHFSDWWKAHAGGSQIRGEKLCVIYGHTHLMDIVFSSEISEAAGCELPEELTLLNIPSWVSDIREEYQKILRDVFAYVDENGFHLLGWDWRGHRPFYIPDDVARRLASYVPIDEHTAQRLLEIGWPEKLIAKIKEPPRLLALRQIGDRPVEDALDFIDSLRVDETRCEYYEVAEQNHSEHLVFNQSQYLLSVMFKLLRREDLFQRIRRRHDPKEPDNDPKRRGHIAKDRFCVLERDIERFYLAGKTDAENNDEIALLALYWLSKKHPLLGNALHRGIIDKLWRKLQSRYDPVRGVLAMDGADRDVAQQRGLKELYPVYKVALFGILAKEMKETNILAKVREKLKEWQHYRGGWETDRNGDMKPNGVANVETTALSILALVD